MYVYCVACVISPAGDLAYDLFDVSVFHYMHEVYAHLFYIL